MKLLAIDTSNKIASVAVFENNEFLGEKLSDDQKTHSEKLLPIIDELLSELSLNIEDIDLFAVSVGPGSFTGIRIGVATIKGIAQALDKAVIGVTSLEGLIELGNNENVCAVINAKHGNVYSQIKYKNQLRTPDCKEISQLLNELKELGEKFVIVGDATEEYENLFNSEIECEILDKKIETSLEIGKVAINKYLSDKSQVKKPNEVNPIYLRLAQPDRGV